MKLTTNTYFDEYCPYPLKLPWYWLQQRVQGFSDRDTWRMPHYLDEQLLAMLDSCEGFYYSYDGRFASFEAYMAMINFCHVALKNIVWLENHRYDRDEQHWHEITPEEYLEFYEDAQKAHELLGRYWYSMGI